MVFAAHPHPFRDFPGRFPGPDLAVSPPLPSDPERPAYVPPLLSIMTRKDRLRDRNCKRFAGVTQGFGR